MSDEWIFNKFKLNNIKNYVYNKNIEVWNAISIRIKNKDIIKIIIDGSFKETLKNKIDPLKTIKELILLC